MYESIPDELKLLKQWCVYKLEYDAVKDKYNKIPYDAVTGNLGKSNDESTWADFNTALGAHSEYDGLGFYFKAPYFGVDIDGVEAELVEYAENPEAENIVSEFYHTLESYTEVSQSKTGIHIICKGKLPTGGRRKANVEMYQEGRFFVMTGQRVGPHQINDCTESIKYLHEKYIGSSHNPVVSNNQLKSSVDLPVSTIIEKAFSSKQGPQFKTLYEGFWESLYTSQSEADLAFANMLAFWTGRDFDKMNQIFETSGLVRDKWYRKQSGSTYGTFVLNRAIADCGQVYSPMNDDGYELIINDNSQSRKFYTQDDTGNAKRFTDQYNGFLKYSYINKGWYFYNGKYWEFDQVGKIKDLADGVVAAMKEDFTYISDPDEEKAFHKHLKATRNNKGKTNMIKEAEHKMSILPGDFDKDIRLFNVMNGYLNLKSGELKDHSEKNLFTKISHVEYTDKIDCPLWMSFLNQIFDNDQELINYIQKAVGYSLTGSTQEQCMFILFGNGQNGKSVFLDIIGDIMGTYATNIQPQTIMVKQQTGGANSDIARLKAARFVTTTEPNEGVRLDEGLVKQLTGGDKVTARHLYQSEFEYLPEFKIWMATNHKPIIRGRDDGIWRRLHLVPFTVKIPKDKVDKNLKYKLKKELTAILNWAVEGCLKWQKEGLEKPRAVELAGNDYKGEMDVVQGFINECCEVGPGKSLKATLLYDMYKNWAKTNGEYVMSNTKFGRELGKQFTKKRVTVGNIYEGITNNSEYDPEKFSLNLFQSQ